MTHSDQDYYGFPVTNFLVTGIEFGDGERMNSKRESSLPPGVGGKIAEHGDKC